MRQLAILAWAAAVACATAGCTNDAVLCPSVVSPAGVRISLGESTLVVVDSTGVHGSLVLRTGDAAGPYGVTWLDAAGAPLAQPAAACADWAIQAGSADSTVATVTLDTTGRWSFSLHGAEPGTTSLRVCLLRGGSVHFALADIPIVISAEASHVRAPVSAAQIVRNGATWATWNYDATLGPDLATGAIVTWQDSTTGELDVQFLDAGRATVRPASPLYSMRVLVRDAPIAEVEPVTGAPWRVRVRGKHAGATVVWLELRYGQTTEYASGAIPLIVAPPTVRESDATCTFKRNGVWQVTVRNGALVDACGAHLTDPGYLQAPLGTLSEHFKFQLVDDACVAVTPSTAGDALVFDIADGGIAHVLTHPAHDFGERFSWHFEGEAAGRTSARVWYIHNGGVGMVTPRLPLVTEVVQ